MNKNKVCLEMFDRSCVDYFDVKNVNVYEFEGDLFETGFDGN